jgi:poly [ADP-ribose] polymerase 2/3/4
LRPRGEKEREREREKRLRPMASSLLIVSLFYSFEAFINGKHVVGKCKEKEQAHKEYKEAISKGHGAYLMDKEGKRREREEREKRTKRAHPGFSSLSLEKEDVFTVSVGNLPPKADCIIKIT